MKNIKDQILNIIINKNLSLYFKDGTYKTTSKGRYKLALNFLSPYISSKNKSFNILEIGPSYGFTSNDIYDFFSTSINNVSVIAFEKNLFLELSKSISGITLLSDNNYLVALHIKFINRIIRITPNRTNIFYSLISKLMQFIWYKFIYNHLQFRPKEYLKLFIELKQDKKVIVSNQLKDVYRYNFDLILCLNVLNKVYYSREEALLYLKSFCKTLKDKSLILLGRNNQRKSVNLSLYRYHKIKNNLVLIDHLNDGWDFEKDLIQF